MNLLVLKGNVIILNCTSNYIGTYITGKYGCGILKFGAAQMKEKAQDMIRNLWGV